MTGVEAQLIKARIVYTADESERVVPGGAVLVVGDRIVAVGEEAEVGAAAAALTQPVRTVDATNMMVLPGFVNAHWHEFFARRVGPTDALRPVRDAEDAPGWMALGGNLLAVSPIFDKLADLAPRLTEREAVDIATYSVWSQLRGGTTTLADLGSFNQPDALMAAFRAVGIRGAISTWVSDVVCEKGASAPRRTRSADSVVRELDRVATMCAADDTGMLRARASVVAVTNMSDEAGRGIAELANRYGLTIGAHLCALRTESPTVREYFGRGSVQRFADLGLLGDRLLGAHTSFADETERRLLIDAAVHISHSPAKYGWVGESTMSETRLIPELAKAGLDVSVSTDGSGRPIGGMVENMRAAWQQHNELYADPTVLRASRALAMATRLPAKGLHWQDRIGSLEPGKQADLVMVRADDWRYLLDPRPLEAFLHLGGSLDIDTVMVAGRTLIKGGSSVHLDETELQRRYLEALRSCAARVFEVAEPQLRQVFAGVAG
ncbi:amidohydrolase family protein [Nocardia terpenica]|uniref:amidohydrolase family protein n=1 Tax=Nocardia terpenica TaxID=455432 RepID=UPI0018E0B790|nr:amidohydrolase family protein [Nocardia terpenica]